MFAPFIVRRQGPGALSSFAKCGSMSESKLNDSSMVLLHTNWSDKQDYINLLRERGVPILDSVDASDSQLASVQFAIVWNPPPELLQKCPRLRCVMSMGAGVDALLGCGQVPENVQLARIVDPVMAQRMATWVVWGVTNWQRRMDDYAAAQRARCWDQSIEGRTNRDNCNVTVGVMGMGVMGLATAKALSALGYDVSGWVRTPEGAGAAAAAANGLQCTAGRSALRSFVAGADVIVCLLPLTPETTGILNAELFSWMRPGSAVINGARGRHLVEADLLAALDNGQLDAALLDVTDPEPLPPSSRLWTHPRVRLTPHVASMTSRETAANQMTANYWSVCKGRGPMPRNVVERVRGY